MTNGPRCLYIARHLAFGLSRARCRSFVLLSDIDGDNDGDGNDVNGDDDEDDDDADNDDYHIHGLWGFQSKNAKLVYHRLKCFPTR